MYWLLMRIEVEARSWLNTKSLFAKVWKEFKGLTYTYHTAKCSEMQIKSNVQAETDKVDKLNLNCSSHFRTKVRNSSVLLLKIHTARWRLVIIFDHKKLYSSGFWTILHKRWKIVVLFGTFDVKAYNVHVHGVQKSLI